MLTLSVKSDAITFEDAKAEAYLLAKQLHVDVELTWSGYVNNGMTGYYVQEEKWVVSHLDTCYHLPTTER